MKTRPTLIRAAGLALAIAAAFPALALADTVVSVQGNTRHYVYYRDHDIYYAPDTRTYYWMADGGWHWGDTLPLAWRGEIERGGVNIELDTDRPYERHEYVVSHYKNHSDAARHRYTYYRDHDIYYAPESHTYYWMADGRWHSGEMLPESSRDYVRSGGIEIELDTDRPYERNDYVVSHYQNVSAPADKVVQERSVKRDGTVTTTTTTTTTPRHYVYYREGNVYFAPESNTYYWRHNGKWESGPNLPAESQVYVRNGGGIEVVLDTDRPYEREAYVTEHYLNTGPGGVVTERTVNRDGSTRTTTSSRRAYVYYGDHQIYYSPETRTYFWLAGGTWHSGATLPYNLRGYARAGGVNVMLDTERPYERHEYVIAHYKNGVYRDDDRRDDD
jgi:hypothetical protein